MTSISRSQINCQHARILRTLVALLLSSALNDTSLASEQNSPHQTDLSLQLEQLHVLRTEVENQQYSLGTYDEELLTPLQSLTEALLSVDAWQEAVTTVEQQIQIVRINDGLYTEAQIPLITRQLSILAAQKDWTAISNRIPYVLLLLERTPKMPAETKLSHIKHMRDWSKLLLIQGPRHQEYLYLLQLQALEASALKLASSQALDTETMQAMIYDRATAELYIALGIAASSDTSQKLINGREYMGSSFSSRNQPFITINDIESVYGARASTVIERSHGMAMARHRQMILSLADPGGDNAERALQDMEKNNPQQAAMIKLFVGDSVLLRQQYELRTDRHIAQARGSSTTGSAARYYKEAWALLLKAGVSETQLNEYFSCPALLPLDRFSAKLELETATKSCITSTNNILRLPDVAVAVVHNGVPGVRYENMQDPGLMTAAEGVKATLQFSIGINGQAERISILAAEPENTSSRIRGKQALESLQFRPALRDGRPVRTDEQTINIHSLEPG